jgi:hypothetical protein
VKPAGENGVCDLTASILVGDQAFHHSRITVDYPLNDWMNMAGR